MGEAERLEQRLIWVCTGAQTYVWGPLVCHFPLLLRGTCLTLYVCARAHSQLARSKASGEQAAIKFIERGDRVNKYVEAEILNHRMLRHPHVIELKEVFLTPEFICIVMEFATGKQGSHHPTTPASLCKCLTDTPQHSALLFFCAQMNARSVPTLFSCRRQPIFICAASHQTKGGMIDPPLQWSRLSVSPPLAALTPCLIRRLMSLLASISWSKQGGTCLSCTHKLVLQVTGSLFVSDISGASCALVLSAACDRPGLLPSQRSGQP